jgi:thioredoxin-related protein
VHGMSRFRTGDGNVLLLRALAMFTATCLLAPAPASAADAHAEFFMPLFGDLKAELATARTEKKKGVVLIYEMDGCPFCERLKRVALRSRDVKQYYHSNFMAYRIDIKGATSITAFDGGVSTESAFAAKQGVRATPTIVFYDLQGTEMTRLVGPPTDASEFLLLGRYVAEGQYKSAPFAAYKLANRGDKK